MVVQRVDQTASVTVAPKGFLMDHQMVYMTAVLTDAMMTILTVHELAVHLVDKKDVLSVDRKDYL